MIKEINELKLDASRRQELSNDKKPLFPCAAYVGEVHHFVSQRIPYHWHPDLEICFVDRGSVRVTLTGNVYLLHKGEGYFINANIMHGVDYNESGPCQYRSMVFDSSILAGAPGSAFDTLYVQPFLEKGPSSFIMKGQKWKNEKQAFDQAWKACKDEKNGYEFLARAALSDIFIDIVNHSLTAAFSKPAHQTEMRIQAMITWINEHYSEKIYLRDMAHSLHISERECQRVFADALHCSPSEYILKKRIGAASTLLAATDQSITEISFQCGFESPSYFTTTFRRQMGHTPKEYRQKIQAEI